jgi:hypothetical protein
MDQTCSSSINTQDTFLTPKGEAHPYAVSLYVQRDPCRTECYLMLSSNFSAHPSPHLGVRKTWYINAQ